MTSLKSTDYYRTEQYKVVVYGGFIRLFFLFVVLVILKDTVNPYIMSDDIMYENVARNYIYYSNSIFDLRSAAMVGVDGYLEVFWPYVMCFSAKLLNTEYAGRLLNCLMSTYSILLVYRLAELVTLQKSIALKASKLFAYLPYPWIICCFPIKDIFLTMSVLVILIDYVKYQHGIKLNLRQCVLLVLLLVCVSFTRGAVSEFLILIGVVFGLNSLLRRGRKYQTLIAVVVCVILLLLFKDVFLSAFEKKVNDYNNDEYVSIGMLRFIQINKLSDIWKLPATYLFAMLQPFSLSIFSPSWDNWSYFLSVMNLSMVPIAWGNFQYAFSKKYNNLFWCATFAMYASVFSLSLGIYRHYLFLFPILTINYASNEFRLKNKSSFVSVMSILLYLIITVLSVK